jgi:hypothetical protein
MVNFSPKDIGYCWKKSSRKAIVMVLSVEPILELNHGLWTFCTKLRPNLFFVNAEMNQSDILKALSTVEDPDLKRDLVTLNMVRDIKIESDKVSFTVVAYDSLPAFEGKNPPGLRKCGAKVVGEKTGIDIFITSSVTTLRDNAPLLPKVKNIVAIASGKWWWGKSTVTPIWLLPLRWLEPK